MGCGEVVILLVLVEWGYIMVGLDFFFVVVELVWYEVVKCGLVNVSFEVVDVSLFIGYDGRFDIIVDSMLFYFMLVEFWEGYL